MSVRHTAILLTTCILAGLGYAFLAPRAAAPGLEVKYQYLLVEVVGPEGWARQHAFSVRWHDQELEPPVVFRVANTTEHFAMGSGGESFGHLLFGKEQAPVSARPDTTFQVRNTGIVSFIEEERIKKDTVALSVVSSVALSPPDYPGEWSPTAGANERESSRAGLEKRIKRLVAAGRVVEIQPVE